MTRSRQCVKNKKVTYKEEYQNIANDKTREVETLKRKVASLEASLNDANHWADFYKERIIEEMGKGRKEYISGFRIGIISGIFIALIIFKLIG